MNSYFHFTIGPVQGFVSQARRTRDFWAGSFLLSWLSGVAMKAVTAQGGTIVFPEANENFMNYLEGKQIEGTQNTSPPKQGSVPNRFKAEVGTSFEPDEVISAVQEAWQALAEHVWEQDIGKIGSKRTRQIWERQINQFWDMNWVITDDQSDSAALDRRKNWRTYNPPSEPGVKCNMMNGWQELSGECRPNREKMNNALWKPLRDQKKNGIEYDLRENEALCAIAFVKRRFSRHFCDFEHTMKQNWTLTGWKIPTGVPSTSYMAAVHWMKNIAEKAPAKTLTDFCKEAKTLTGQYGEWQTSIHCLGKTDEKFKSLDGNVFYLNNLENPLMFDEEKIKPTAKLLAELNKAEDIKPASPFYAILMMDGDSLGKSMSDPKLQTIITKKLGYFTQNVSSIVEECNGFLIYAGGDDVLAILPLEDAIPCAVKLRTNYEGCFATTDMEGKTSLSGAIEFVHVKTPLTQVLADAHQLLDDIAKEKSGRDALAIRVWKPGGKHLEWSQPWEVALFDTEKTYVERLADDFQQQDETFSSKFLYKIRDYFTLLNPVKGSTEILDEDAVNKFMAMEYLNSADKPAKRPFGMAQAIETVKPLIEQCRAVTRIDESSRKDWQKSNQLTVDAALLIRFLATKGVNL